MRIMRVVVTVLKMPLWLVQLGTGAKSFLDNPVIGSAWLNRLGLHRRRVGLAMAMAQWRRRRLARDVRREWRDAFERDGYVAIEGFLPQEEFQSLRDAVLNHSAPAREQQQGDAITRRIAVDSALLQALPGLRRLLTRPDLRALFHYVASYAIEPLHYVQTILTHRVESAPDPQLALHADAFHPSLKAWYFLNDVAVDEAPFTYVPGSHRLTPARLGWEYRRSIALPDAHDRLSSRGSLRISEDELASLGLPGPKPIAVPANTLVVADTYGFHCRGASSRPSARVEIWSYGRRNPFIPWLGGDILSLPGIAERRINWLWRIRDRFERRIGQPWKAVGPQRPVDDVAEEVGRRSVRAS